MRPWLLLVTFGLGACGNVATGPVQEPTAEDQAVAPPSDLGDEEQAAPPPDGDDGVPSPDAPPPVTTSPHALGSLAERPEWLRVDALLDENEGLTAYTFDVYRLGDNGQPELVYSRSVNQSRDTGLKIASASKTITAAAVLRAALDAGDDPLSLATTASVLATPSGACANLPAAAAQVSLDHLLHQTSGISDVDHECVDAYWNVDTPPTPSAMRRCACQILKDRLVASEIGDTFRYGANNFTVAAAIVEAVQGESWYDWFASVRAELGLGADAIDYGLVSDGVQTGRNSNVAGGISASALAYAPFLAALTPGKPGAALYAAPFGDEVTIAASPFDAFGVPMRYGLGNWSTCVQPWPERSEWPNGDYGFLTLDYESCPKRINHSLGKYGFMPWISSGAQQETFFAVLATNLSDLPSEGRVSQVSFDTHLMIEPALTGIFSTRE